MDDISKTLCITGASSGIGEAISYEYAKRKYHILLCGRNEKQLQKVAKQCKKMGARSTQTLIFDYKQTSKCVNEIKKIAQNVDVAILCAGVSQRARALDAGHVIVETLFRVNALTPMALSCEFVNSWQRGIKFDTATGSETSKNTGNRKRQLVIVSSIASRMCVPLRSSYCASKKALEIYIQTLQNELYSKHYAGSHKKHVNSDIKPPIEITTVIPGFVRTNVSQNALDENGNKWEHLDPNQAKGISSSQAAKKIVDKLSLISVPRQIYVGMNVSLQILLFLARVCPKLANFILTRTKTTR